jgi:hypothetical protein
MAGEIFGCAHNYSVARGRFYIVEGPAGQPLKVTTSFWDFLVNVGLVRAVKGDFTSQADVNAYVAARTAPTGVAGALGFTPQGPWEFFSLPQQLVFTTQPPSSVAAGVGFSVVVTCQDPTGNVAAHWVGGEVRVRISVGPLFPQADVLSGTKILTVVNGVASFTGLSINLPGVYGLGAIPIPERVGVGLLHPFPPPGEKLWVVKSDTSTPITVT